MSEKELKTRIFSMEGIEKNYTVTKCIEDGVRITTEWEDRGKKYSLSAVLSDDGIDRLTLIERSSKNNGSYTSLKLNNEDVEKLMNFDGAAFLKDCFTISSNL